MTHILRLTLALMLAVVFPASICPAQEPVASSIPPAPVPQQVLTAKKIFISNVPGALFDLPRNGEDDSYRPYNQFYASLKSWGYYELVSAPADADLILEIALNTRPMIGNAMTQTPVYQVHFDLIVRDPKTQTVLWWFSEPLQGANRVATGEKNYNQAMTNLVNDFKKLTNQQPDSSGNKK
jgi:hypothetical protein